MRSPRASAVVPLLCAAVLLPLSAWPVTRTPAVLLAAVLAAAAPAVGVLLHRPRSRLPWAAVSVMLACWLAAMALAARAPTAAVVLQSAGIAVAVGLFVVLFGRWWRRGVDRRRRHRATWGRRTDQFVVAVVVGLAVVQSTAAALDPAVAWPVPVGPVDLVLVCLLLRFVASRGDLGPSMALLVAGGVGAAVYDCLAADSGVRIPGPQHPSAVLWTAAMCAFLAGSLHPGMRTAFDPTVLGRLRSESARLVGLTPLVLVPIALSLLHSGDQLPSTVHLSSAAVVSALAIVRGAQTIRSSEEQARLDPLTGLANRRGLRAAFEDLVSPVAAPPAPADAVVGRLALLDLDDFKHVNDTWGHETGDHLLVSVALRLLAAVGGGGTVARSGGDEFVLLLTAAGPGVGELLERVLATPVELGGRTFPVRCSAGWVELTATSSLPLALADADIALYTSKGTARGTATRFVPGQREQVLGTLALADDVRRLAAREHGSGELVLHYQPLVALPDRSVTGCEALVRWEHPTRGLLFPDTFLPVAEAEGHGAALDAWVLRAACRRALAWPADWTVSVNLGRSSMLDPGLADLVRRTLAEAQLPPHRLRLEITEHDQLPPDAGVPCLRELADLGVGISLDDFGTGYTSVAYLQRYPVSVLKLDRSITGPDAGGALLGGLVALAAALGVAVLAEGIEDDDQCARLAALGVDAGQGWLFGRPVPDPCATVPNS